MRFFTIGILVVILALYGCAAAKYSSGIKNIDTLVQKKQYSQAEKQIKNIIAYFPEKPEPFYYYGIINYFTGNYYECLLNFDTAERYGLKDVNDLYLKKGISLYNTGHLKESEKVLLHSLELQPTAEAQKYIGLIRYELRDYTGAIEPLKAASVDFQNDLQINFYLGMAYFITGRNAQSLTYFEKALEIEPDNPEIMFNTANLYMLNDRYEEAVGLYTGIQPESPYGEDSIYNCAEAYIKTGKYDSAAQLLRYLIGKNPHDYNARYNLAAALIKSEDYVSAVEILNDLQIINSTDARISYNLGLAYEGLGQTSLSLDFFKTAVTQDPRNPLYHYAYGLGLSENGDQEEAAVRMETVMKLDPDNINAGNWLENYRSSKIPSKQ